MDEKFKIKSYGYGELALLYFPNSKKKSASVQFRRWIRINQLLQKELSKNGYKQGQKLLTPKQVEIFVNIFGEP